MQKRINRKAEGTQGLALTLKRILSLRGVLKPHSYLKKAGLTGNTATNLLQGQVGGLRWEQLEQLCLALNCTPNDLFTWRGDGSNLPSYHELRKLVRPETVLNLTNKLNSLSPDEAEKWMGGEG